MSAVAVRSELISTIFVVSAVEDHSLWIRKYGMNIEKIKFSLQLF